MTKIERLQAEVNQLVAAEEKETARLKAMNAKLLEALEKIQGLRRYSISQGILIDPFPDAFLKVTEVTPIVRAAIKAATEG